MYLDDLNSVAKGRRIVRVRETTKAEDLILYGYSSQNRGLAVELDNGMTLIAQQDAEGNGPGFLGYAPTSFFKREG